MEDIEEGMAVVAGVPMDHGVVLTRTGTRYGPRAIREASLFYRSVQEAGFEKTSVNADTGVAMRLKKQPGLVDIGDFTIYPQDLMKTSESVSDGVYQVLRRGGLPILLGGDHYLTYPAFEGLARAMAERSDNVRLGHVHIDSHTDFRDRYTGFGKYNHGTSVRRISENSVIGYKNMAWVGLNGNIMDADIYRIYKDHGLKMVSASDIRNRGIAEAITDAVETAADGADAIYVSIDIDVVDAAYAPGTGVPVFDGISAKDFLTATETLSRYKMIAALDLCEVSPPFDPTERTAYLAANGLVTFLAPYLFDIVNLYPDATAP
jgi:agmatinase